MSFSNEKIKRSAPGGTIIMPLEGSVPFCLKIPTYTFHTGTFHKRYNMVPENENIIYLYIVRYTLDMTICPKKARPV